jgi:hypothetical protein
MALQPNHLIERAAALLHSSNALRLRNASPDLVNEALNGAPTPLSAPPPGLPPAPLLPTLSPEPLVLLPLPVSLASPLPRLC